jgi:16S rRNA (cytosine1402-N4)-methyltransferase
MRMDRDQPLTAARLLDTVDELTLTQLLRDYGDEPHARRIARAVVAARPLVTTGQLAEVVRSAVPAAARRRSGHPAKRVFQAVRIAVNAELDVLPGAIDTAIGRLQPGGRIGVLAYHSGEDRIVKDSLRRAETGGCTCPPRLPCVCGAQPQVRLLWRGAHKPTVAEVERNRRAESARLRAAEKLREVR